MNLFALYLKIKKKGLSRFFVKQQTRLVTNVLYSLNALSPASEHFDIAVVGKNPLLQLLLEQKGHVMERKIAHHVRQDIFLPLHLPVIAITVVTTITIESVFRRTIS